MKASTTVPKVDSLYLAKENNEETFEVKMGQVDGSGNFIIIDQDLTTVMDETTPSDNELTTLYLDEDLKTIKFLEEVEAIEQSSTKDQKDLRPVDQSGSHSVTTQICHDDDEDVLKDCESSSD